MDQNQIWWTLVTTADQLWDVVTGQSPAVHGLERQAGPEKLK